MSKKLLILGTILLATTTSLVAIAAWRFDTIVSSYKPLIQERLSTTLGAPVKIGQISATLFPRPALTIRDVQTGDQAAQQTGSQSGIRIAELSANASLLPLISGRLTISSLRLRLPELTLRRDAHSVHVAGMESLQRETNPALPRGGQTKRSSSMPLDVEIERVMIEGGALHLESLIDARRISFSNITLDSQLALRGSDISVPAGTLSLTGPEQLPIKASAERCALEGAKKAVSCSAITVASTAGSLLLSGSYSAEEQKGFLRVSSSDLMLAQLQATLAPFIPELSSIALAGTARTTFELDVRDSSPVIQGGKLFLDGLQFRPNGKLQITDARGEIDVQGPLTDLIASTRSLQLMLHRELLEVAAKLRLTPSQLALESLSVQGFSGSAELPSVITLAPKPISLAGKHSARNISLQSLLQTIQPNSKIPLTGTLASLKGEITSLTPSRPDSAQARTEVVIKNGSLIGWNLPGQLMSNISGLPFISDSLRRKIPPEFERFFSRPDTEVRELLVSADLEKGRVMLTRVSLVSDLFDLSGSGTYALTGDLDLTSELIFDKEFSRALVLKVPELKGLADPADRLVVPLSIKGTLSAPLVYPDLAKIAGKTSAGVLQKALQNGLKGARGLGKDLKKILGF